jgi:type IV secretory pathway component VirB8
MSIQEKESGQDSKLVKEADDITKQSIFQKNKNKKLAATTIVLFLIILILVTVLSGAVFREGA